MKQIVLRIIAPQVPALDVSTGVIDEKQGCYVPDADPGQVLHDLVPAAKDLCQFTTILGGKVVLTQGNSGPFVTSVCKSDRFIGLELLPNLFILKLNDDGTKEEEKPR